MVVNCIRNRFQQKDKIKTFQTMEILLLKALREEDFGQVAIKIISSLNASQKLVVSDVLKLVKLILTAHATNAVSESSCSTFV